MNYALRKLLDRSYPNVLHKQRKKTHSVVYDTKDELNFILNNSTAA